MNGIQPENPDYDHLKMLINSSDEQLDFKTLLDKLGDKFILFQTPATSSKDNNPAITGYFKTGEDKSVKGANGTSSSSVMQTIPIPKDQQSANGGWVQDKQEWTDNNKDYGKGNNKGYGKGKGKGKGLGKGIEVLVLKIRKRKAKQK